METINTNEEFECFLSKTTELKDLALSNFSVGHYGGGRVDYTNIKIKNCIITNVHFKYLNLENCVIENSQFNNCKFIMSTMEKSAFYNCKINESAFLEKNNFCDSVFVNCEFANTYFGKKLAIKTLTFVGCKGIVAGALEDFNFLASKVNEKIYISTQHEIFELSEFHHYYLEYIGKNRKAYDTLLESLKLFLNNEGIKNE